MAIEDLLQKMSEADLDLYKKQLRQSLTTLNPQDRSAVLTRIKGVPELSDVTYSDAEMWQPQEDKPWYQDVGGALMTGLEWLGSIWSLPGQAVHGAAQRTLTPEVPWTVVKPSEKLKPLLSQDILDQLKRYETYERERGQTLGEQIGERLPGGEKYEEYRQLPLWQQLLYEAPMILGTAGISATGISAALKPAAQAGKVLPKVSRAALAPAVGAEYAIGLPLRGAAKGVGAIARKISPKLTAPKLMPDLQNFDDVIKIASKPDVARRLANLPVFKRTGLSRTIGGLAAVAEKPVEWGVAGLRVLQAEAYTKTSLIMSRLERLGASRKVFTLADDGTIKVGSLKGTHLNTIRTYPQKYASRLTPEQNTWVKQASEIEGAKLDFLKRNGIEINELTFGEGGEYAGRRVAGMLDAEGNLASYAYIGAGPSRVGAKVPFEKVRVFKDIDDAIKAGYRYLPEEEALALNVKAAYNRVANKQMAEWLLPKIPHRTAAVDPMLKLSRAEMIERRAAWKQMEQVSLRLKAGEKIPWTQWKGIKPLYPEQYSKLRNLNQLAASGAKVKARDVDDILRFVEVERNWYRKEFTQLARWHKEARAAGMRPAYEEAMVMEPAFAGKILTGPEAKETARFLMRELHPDFSKALNSVNLVNAVGRYFMLAGDMSPMTIQLILLPFFNPKASARALVGFGKAFFNPQFHANYLTKNADIIGPNLVLAKTGTEFTEAFASWGLLSKGPLRVAAKPLVPFQRAFECCLDVAGIEMRKSLNHLCTTAARTAEVEAFINEFRGLVSTAKLGLSPVQRQLETMMLLAPRYNRAIAALLVDAGKGGLRGSLARQSLAQGVAGMSALAIGVSLAMGESMEEAVEHLKPGPKFFTWQIAGQNVGPGSKIRSVVNLFAQSAKNPDDLFKLSMENPNLRFIRGNLSPAVSTGLDLLIGEDYIGDPTRDSMVHLTKRVLAENLLPIWVQSVALEGGGDVLGLGTRGAVEFMGMRGYPMLPYQKRDELRDELAQKEYKMSWDELASPTGPGELARIKIERSSTELQELTKEAEEKSHAMAQGEGKVWDAWHEEGRGIEGQYQKAINLAAREFDATGDGITFREKVDNANKSRRDAYSLREEKEDYAVIRDYFAEPLDEKARAKMNPKDLARREYYEMMYSADMYDEYGNYNFDEAERREEAFVRKYGQSYLDYIKEFTGAKWDAPPAFKLLNESRALLEPYWSRADQIWAQYPPELRRLSDEIKLIGRTNPILEKQYLKRYRLILYIRKKIAEDRKRLKTQYPQIAWALAVFYGY